ncbi:PIN domain-containing protein [Allosphingosinicella humi]
MNALIDTNIAIHLRDGDPRILQLYAALDASPALSIISRVELEGGVVARPEYAAQRRAALDAMVTELEILDFDEAAANAYREIVAAAGYVRARILDRMIAATALSRGLSLITINHVDFRDIPGLDLIAWEASGG